MEGAKLRAGLKPPPENGAFYERKVDVKYTAVDINNMYFKNKRYETEKQMTKEASPFRTIAT